MSTCWHLGARHYGRACPDSSPMFEGQGMVIATATGYTASLTELMWKSSTRSGGILAKLK